MSKETTKDNLKNWEFFTQKLVEQFARKYFGKDYEMWWVSDTVGDALYINDYWFNVNDIVQFMRCDYSKKDMFDYYDYALECHIDKMSPLNIYSWRKLYKNK